VRTRFYSSCEKTAQILHRGPVELRVSRTLSRSLSKVAGDQEFKSGFLNLNPRLSHK
jgi:hypothetical protein